MTQAHVDASDAVWRRRLVEELTGAGALSSEPWREAFGAVPRHVFAPRFWHWNGQAGADRQFYDGADPALRDRWLELAYADDSLVTHLRPDDTAVSSSTQPSLMARMLEALDVTDGHRVLEIGTGTGYNAALLAHRLGDGQVVTVEVDPVVAEEAREALAAAGYHPTVVTADGLAGYAPGGPYDRVIATCSTGRVPAAWLDQTRPGGVILANLATGVVRLVVDADGRTAAGRFLPGFAGFIEARTADSAPPLSYQRVLEVTAGTGQESPAEVTGDYGDLEFLAFLWLHTPSVARVGVTYDDRPEEEFRFAEPDGSWARFTTAGGGAVVQGRSRRLGDEIEAVRAVWAAAGRPAHDRLGLTVYADGGHDLWVDAPDGRRRWSLPTHRPER